jgi:hypothetical protein
MTIILSSSDTASMSCDMMYCNTVVTSNMSLLVELGASTVRSVLWISLLWQMLLHRGRQIFPICVWCLWTRSVGWYSHEADHIENTATNVTSIVARGQLPNNTSIRLRIYKVGA